MVYALRLLVGGINRTTVQTSAEASTTLNSMINTNPSLPNVIQDSDPRFSVEEAILRAAIYIPSTFITLNASNISAIVMVLGTAVPGGQRWTVGYAKNSLKIGLPILSGSIYLTIHCKTLRFLQNMWPMLSTTYHGIWGM